MSHVVCSPANQANATMTHTTYCGATLHGIDRRSYRTILSIACSMIITTTFFLFLLSFGCHRCARHPSLFILRSTGSVCNPHSFYSPVSVGSVYWIEWTRPENMATLEFSFPVGAHSPHSSIYIYSYNRGFTALAHGKRKMLRML